MPKPNNRPRPARSATILAFDPQSRQSSRRHSEPALSLEQLDTAQKAEAAALGLTDRDFEADPDSYYHAHLILDIEAAYRKSAEHGRVRLNAVIMDQFHDGYSTGLEDARLTRARR